MRAAPETDASFAFARAMHSLYRTEPGSPDGDVPGALNVAFEKLAGEQHLFGGAEAARPYITIEEFHLRDRIGSGGMGSVYLAWSESLRRIVALKVLHHSFADSRQGERLNQEATRLARVKHPNVVQIYQIASQAHWRTVRPPEDDGPLQDGTTAIIVMEYVEGKALGEWLAAGPPWRTIVDVFLQVARGLGAAHRVGLLHTDVTPGNILIDANNTAKLIDFGLSREGERVATGSENPSARQKQQGRHQQKAERVAEDLGHEAGAQKQQDQHKQEAEHASNHTEHQPPAWYPELTVREIGGTPGYAAPEQLRRDATIDARSDLFGLSASLWQAITGQLPYAPEALDPRLVGAGPPPRLRLETWPRRRPRWLRDLLARGLDFERERRPANMHAFVSAIESNFMPPNPWWGRLVASAASIAVVALTYFVWPEPAAPAPFNPGDLGIEDVWNDARAADLAGGAQALGPKAKYAWPWLQRSIQDYADTWRATREAALAQLPYWPGELSVRAGRCLMEASATLDSVLTGVDVSLRRTSEPAAPWWLVAQRSRAELIPPSLCANTVYLTSLTHTDAAASQRYAEGYQHYLIGDLEAADVAFQAALQVAVDDPGRAAWIHLRIASVALAHANHASAEDHLLTALGLTERSGDRLLRLLVFSWLLHVAVEAGEYDIAMRTYAMALGSVRAFADENDRAIRDKASGLHLQAAWAMARLAANGAEVRCPIDCDHAPITLTHCTAAATATAWTCSTDLLALSEANATTMDRRIEVVATRGEVAWLRQDLPAARASLREALRLDAELAPITVHTASLHDTLGSIEYDLRLFAFAEVAYRRALDTRVAFGEEDTAAAARLHRLIAALADTRGAYFTAREHAERALELIDHPGISVDAAAAVELLDILGSLYIDTTATLNEDRGLLLLRRGFELAADPSLTDVHRVFVAGIHLNLARAEFRHGNHQTAGALLDAGLLRLGDADEPLATTMRQLRDDLKLPHVPPSPALGPTR